MSHELKELKAQREALDAQINKLSSTARTEAIAHIRDLMVTHALEMSEIVRGKPKAPTPTLGGVKVPPKYRDSIGNAWTGRGIQPRWLQAALNGGATLDQFLIKA